MLIFISLIYNRSDVKLVGELKVVEGTVAEERVVEGPIVQRTLAERSVKEKKRVLDELVVKETVNKMLQVYTVAVKLSGDEDLYQGSCSEDLLLFSFSC